MSPVHGLWGMGDNLHWPTLVLFLSPLRACGNFSGSHRIKPITFSISMACGRVSASGYQHMSLPHANTVSDGCCRM